jgi:hypothetical protein
MKTKFNALTTLLLLVATFTTARAELTSKVGVQSVYDSNIYRLESREVDAWITKINPGVAFSVKGEGSSYSLDAEAEAGIYSQSKRGDDDYTDYRVTGMGNWILNERNQLEAMLRHQSGHDDRGTSRMDVAGNKVANANFSDEPDEWKDNAVDAKYIFGAEGARGSVVTSMGYSQKDYTNNEPQTDSLSRDDTKFGVLGLLKIMPKTTMLLEARFKDIDYAEDSPPATQNDRDSMDSRYFVGLEWESTAKTSGSVRVGYQEKDPNDAAFDNFYASAWEADVIWAPRSYSTLRATIFRGVEDSSDAVTYIKSDIFTLAWNHKWSNRYSTSVFGEIEGQEYFGLNRDDDIHTWGFLGRYQHSPQLAIKGEYRYEDRDSSTNGLDYTRNLVTFSADVSFD